MADHVTVDVVDRPEAGVLRLLRGARRRSDEGVRVFARTTVDFSPRVVPELTPRRVAVVAAWPSREAAERRWPDVLGPLVAGREHWHLLGEVTRDHATLPWAGWTPDATGAAVTKRDQPVLVLIRGAFKAHRMPQFALAARRAAGQLATASGYVGGVGLLGPRGENTSMSCWATLRDAQDYAYRNSPHAEVIEASRSWVRGETFLQVRPLATSGTLAGADPFAGVGTAR